MNIAYSSSDSYAPIAGVSLYSLLLSNRAVKELNVYIIENQMSERNKRKFEEMCREFSRPLTFVPISDINAAVGRNIDIGRWNISTFARLFEASLLPDEVEKVIHVDCDTMVLDSLEPLWNVPLDGKIAAGALECIGDSYKTEIGLAPDDTYINAGNVVLNLKKIREDGTEELFKDYIAKHAQLSFVDQAVLNGCVKSDEKLALPLKYNTYSIVYYIKYKNLKKVKRVTRYYTEAEVEKAKQNPCIVHFTTCFMDGTRPWIEHNRHPMLAKYLELKAASPWADEPLWSDDRNFVKKTAGKLFNTLPQGFVARSMGFVHAVLIPFKNKHGAR